MEVSFGSFLERVLSEISRDLASHADQSIESQAARSFLELLDEFFFKTDPELGRHAIRRGGHAVLFGIPQILGI